MAHPSYDKRKQLAASGVILLRPQASFHVMAVVLFSAGSDVLRYASSPSGMHFWHADNMGELACAHGWLRVGLWGSTVWLYACGSVDDGAWSSSLPHLTLALSCQFTRAQGTALVLSQEKSEQPLPELCMSAKKNREPITRPPFQFCRLVTSSAVNLNSRQELLIVRTFESVCLVSRLVTVCTEPSLKATKSTACPTPLEGVPCLPLQSTLLRLVKHGR